MKERKIFYYKKAKKGQIVNMKGKICGSLVGYTALEGEGKVEGDSKRVGWEEERLERKGFD